MNTSDYLDTIKERLNLPSDYAVAARLGESRARISHYRTGRYQMDADLIPKVAELLGESPLVILAEIAAARAKSEFERDSFKQLATMARSQKTEELLPIKSQKIEQKQELDECHCRT